ncbi:MAG: tetratricopeptide repeat protein [Planctomycetes bacterium]|nr:tetratricopeptide repeat protein [Planctomycetota bacterium]
MFAEQAWPNLLLFAAGQVAAWIYLRSGRIGIGLAATAALWVLADWFLLARFAFRVGVGASSWPLAGMQAVALATVATLLLAWWRRTSSPAARARLPRFRAAQAAYLRGDLDGAGAAFRRLVRTDPWDAAAWIALANVLARQGRARPARRCLVHARRLDTRRQYGDLIRHQLALAAHTPVPPPPPTTVADVATAPTT